VEYRLPKVAAVAEAYTDALPVPFVDVECTVLHMGQSSVHCKVYSAFHPSWVGK